MKKQRISFSFVYPVNNFITRTDNQRNLNFIHVADLVVSGIGYKYCSPFPEHLEKCYDYELTELKYENENILWMLPALDARDAIHEACIRHIDHLFKGEASEYEPEMSPGKDLAKVIYLPEKSKAK